MSKYTVIRAVYEKTGEVREVVGGTLQYERVAKWIDVGPADCAEDAKLRYTPLQYGYGLVLRHN